MGNLQQYVEGMAELTAKQNIRYLDLFSTGQLSITTSRPFAFKTNFWLIYLLTFWRKEGKILSSI